MLIEPTADPILTRWRAALDATYGGRIGRSASEVPRRISERFSHLPSGWANRLTTRDAWGNAGHDRGVKQGFA
jgi:hypothetical protein